MRTVNLPITEKGIDYISLNRYNSRGTNKGDINKMKHLLKKAINRELTNKQRQCLMMYYFEGKKMTEIAKELNLNKSTVTRHIQKAKHNLKCAADYYAN